jgi:VIT1/CCC1 family predicted Fe2+/Mn2+ transporter
MTPEEATAHADEVLRDFTLESTQAAVPVGDSTSAAIDEHEAIGTGIGAAVSSFCFFASGALIPVLPYLFGLQGTAAVLVASVLVGLVLLGTGAIVGLLSGASPLKRALRQLAIGFGAAAATYALGLLFGANLG